MQNVNDTLMGIVVGIWISLVLFWAFAGLHKTIAKRLGISLFTCCCDTNAAPAQDNADASAGQAKTTSIPVEDTPANRAQLAAIKATTLSESLRRADQDYVDALHKAYVDLHFYVDANTTELAIAGLTRDAALAKARESEGKLKEAINRLNADSLDTMQSIAKPL